MLPELGDLTEPLLFRGKFKNQIDFGWNECETAISQSVYHKNIEIINFQSQKESLNIFPDYWYGECYDIHQIAKLIDMGYSFVLTRMSCFNKSLDSLCNFIEEKYSACSDAHIYGGLYPESKSFNSHTDEPHNLIIQLEGKSRWIVYKEKFKGVSIFNDNTNLTPIMDCVLEPGDGIFIPSLQSHLAIPLSKRISASIPFHSNYKKSLKRGWIKIGD